MSYTHVRRISETRSLTDYLAHGQKGTARYVLHRVEGTTRIAAMTCDIAPVGAEHSEQEVIDAFVEKAQALAVAQGRQVQARSIVQSFERDEFDPDNADDVQRVNDLGYALAKELHPNSDALVITHIDGVGRKPHNHIVVLNHDNETGRALRGGDLYWQYQRTNDELMREQGCRVMEHGERGRDQRTFWEQQREGSKVGEFDRWLGDTTMECLADPRCTDAAAYRELLAERGIQLIEQTHTIKASADGQRPEHESVGWTYTARDEFGEKDRERRRKASSLSTEHTYEGAQEIFEINRTRKAERDEREGHDRAAGARVVDLGVVERVDLDALRAGRADDEGRRPDRGAARDGRGVEADRERTDERRPERRQPRRLGDGLGRSR